MQKPMSLGFLDTPPLRDDALPVQKREHCPAKRGLQVMHRFLAWVLFLGKRTLDYKLSIYTISYRMVRSVSIVPM
jgi:hypothetical protein